MGKLFAFVTISLLAKGFEAAVVKPYLGTAGFLEIAESIRTEGVSVSMLVTASADGLKLYTEVDWAASIL